tara:strand:+ start:21844 stop:22479 length:636 start_codon:yes stop_codon:yes gene_type:complete
MKNLLLVTLFTVAMATVMACSKTSDTDRANTQTAAATTSDGYTRVNEGDYPDAPVQIVKFSDYQCPACGYFVPIEKKLKEEYGDKINIVTKHFPLSMHPYAHVAARSVEAARKQGKYLEMHYKIFDGQETWSKGNAETIFIGYAQDIGLDVEQFKKDMNSAEMNKIVMEDRKEGVELGIRSTPTFFINGNLVEKNPSTVNGFKILIDQYLD